MKRKEDGECFKINFIYQLFFLKIKSASAALNNQESKERKPQTKTNKQTNNNKRKMKEKMNKEKDK